MRWVKLIGKKFGFIQEVISYSFFALAAVLACFEVFSRYFFSSSHAWVEELVKLLIIYAVFITAGLTLMKGDISEWISFWRNSKGNIKK